MKKASPATIFWQTRRSPPFLLSTFEVPGRHRRPSTAAQAASINARNKAMELFKILDAVIDNAGDMLNQRAAVEEALTEDAIAAYADNAMDITLTASQAQQI